MSGGVSVGGLGSPVVAPSVITAQDASFTLDGQVYSRKTNTIKDVLSGVTINLMKADAVNAKIISVDKAGDTAPQVMQALVDAYNDLVLTAKKLSAKASPSSSSSSDGSLANSPTALNFLKQIKTMLAGDIHYTLAGTAGTLNMGDLGFEMQKNGTAKFNSTTFNSTLSVKDPDTGVITSKNKSAILASGIKVGYATYVTRDPVTGAEISKDTTDVTLDAYLTSLLTAATITRNGITKPDLGAFERQINNEKTNLKDMEKKQVELQMRLDAKQKSYYSQYSALNALLFKLSNTSNSLTNALSGLTNGQNNK
jgi:flagellar hook-associated protein 2